MAYDVIVIGTGGVGSAALYYAAARGLRVLGLDRFPPGHDRGSSHGQTRAIRQAYFEHPAYVPLLRAAYALWDELEQEASCRLLHRVGLLEVGPADGHVIPGVLASAAAHGLTIERWRTSDVHRNFPGFRIPDGNEIVFEPNAGFLAVEQCVTTYCQLACRRGAELRTGIEVHAIEPLDAGVIVHTSDGPRHAAGAIVAAGAWAARLLADLQLPLRIVRKHLHWYATRDDAYDVRRGCPVYFFELGNDFFYGFPQLDERGVKVAEHTGGTEIDDPLADPRRVDPLDRARVESFLARCLPQVELRPTDHVVCFYTMTPDQHFIVDRHPRCHRVSYAAGLSGHGFKFASVLGRVLVDLATDGHTDLPTAFLQRTRWAG